MGFSKVWLPQSNHTNVTNKVWQKKWDGYWIWAFSKPSEIDLHRFIMVSLSNFFVHVSRTRISSFRSLYCLLLHTTYSIRCHTFSMMFRSDLRACQTAHLLRQHIYSISGTSALFCSVDVDTRIVLRRNPFVLTKLSMIPQGR